MRKNPRKERHGVRGVSTKIPLSTLPVEEIPTVMADMQVAVRDKSQMMEQVEAMMKDVSPGAVDVIVIGGGPGGYVAAIRAAQLGGRVVVVEKDSLGGVCLNRGCIPTKAMLSSADVYDLAVRRCGEFGVNAKGVSLDYAAVTGRRDKIVKQTVSGVGYLMKKNDIRVISGTAKLKSASSVEVKTSDGKTETVEGRNIIIATGSEPVQLPIEGLDGKNVWDSDAAMKADSVPSSILVIGGGAIGVEWGYLFKKFGADVTIVEMISQILPLTDSEVAGELKKILVKGGIDILTDSKVSKVTKKGAKLTALIETGKDKKEITVDKILVAVGRRPVSSDMGLEALGVKTDRGKILVNESMQTDVRGIYAVGDVTGGMLLAHKASEEGVIAAENCMGRKTRMNYNTVPACVYTSPEVATVGLTEDEAKKRGIDVKVGRSLFMPNGKAKGIGERDGFVKFIAEARYGEILGCHIIGPHATDLIHEAVIAMEAEATIDQVGKTVHAHPSLAEVIKEAALDADGESIHNG